MGQRRQRRRPPVRLARLAGTPIRMALRTGAVVRVADATATAERVKDRLGSVHAQRTHDHPGSLQARPRWCIPTPMPLEWCLDQPPDERQIILQALNAVGLVDRLRAHLNATTP